MPNFKSIVAVLVAVLLDAAVSASATYADAPFFISLDNPPWGVRGDSLPGISANGLVVVGGMGSSSTGPNIEAFRWTQASGMVGLGDIAGGDFFGWAAGASGDGSVVAGTGTYGDFRAGQTEAWGWTPSTGMIGLGDLPGGDFSSRADGVSADGSTIVGKVNSAIGDEAFRWTQDAGMVGLGYPPGTFGSGAVAASADGSVVVGWLSPNGDTRSEAMRWTENTGMVGLGDLPGGEHYGAAQAVSADASVVVGFSSSENNGSEGFEAFRWTESTGMVGLGDFPGGHFASVANAVSADGSIVIGNSSTDTFYEAFIWDAAHGMRRLHDVLVNDYGLGPSLADWFLTSADAISADGMTIVGHGRGPESNVGWIAHIPEPSSGLLLCIGSATWMLVRSFRKHSSMNTRMAA